MRLRPLAFALAGALAGLALVWASGRRPSPASEASAPGELSVETQRAAAPGGESLEGISVLRELDRRAPRSAVSLQEELPAGAWVAGRALLSCGAPLANHELALFASRYAPEAEALQIETDATGAFRFRSEPGSANTGWLGSPSRPDLTPERIPVQWSQSTGATWVIPGSALELEVQTAAGIPVADSWVSVSIEDPITQLATRYGAVTDRRGRVEFLTNRTGLVSARPGHYGDPRAKTTSLGVLGPGMKLNEILVLSDLAGALRVRVWAGSQPIDRFSFTVMDAQDDVVLATIHSSEVGADGTFARLPLGPARVELIPVSKQPPSLYVVRGPGIVEVELEEGSAAEVEFEVDLLARARLDLRRLEFGLVEVMARPVGPGVDEEFRRLEQLAQYDDRGPAQLKTSVRTGSTCYTPLLAEGEWEFEVQYVYTFSGRPAAARAYLWNGEITEVLF